MSLQKMRKQRGYSQSQLAQASGVSVRTIQNYECGKRNIDRADALIVQKLSQALECNAGEILNTFTKQKI